MRILKKFRRRLLRKQERFADMEQEFWPLHERCKPFTMTSTERLYALYKSMQYVALHRIPGDIVECGVWKGGSAMLCALLMSDQAPEGRSLYLYDTFTGMTEPDDRDVSFRNVPAREVWRRRRKGAVTDWAYSPLEEVQRNLLSTGVSRERVVFVEGKVEETLPRVIPSRIALLRLDTDWYSSTYHEMVHLFPRLSAGGVLIVDDYGVWKGARQAVDQYLSERRPRILLTRIDRGARLCVKLE
jgi:hypothetical protein